MAACKAAKITSNVSSSTSSNSTTNTNSLTRDSTAAASSATTDICHNFHELCRSCGKTNDQLYDLFQSSPNNNSNNNTSSPFNTSSTTCYTHLNNNNNNSCSTSCTTSSLTNKPSTTAVGHITDAVGCTKSGGNLTTLDTVAATAKASAKGQSNMDNILQEMQIWQLMVSEKFFS